MEQICEFVNADAAKIITDFVGDNEGFDEFYERVQEMILETYGVYTTIMFWTSEEQVHFASLQADPITSFGIPSYGFICSKHYCDVGCEDLDHWDLNHCYNTGGKVTCRRILRVERGPPVRCTFIEQD